MLFPPHMPTEAEEYLLTPGSILYVPRGYWHETESDEASISLHVHHMPVPWVDAVLVTLRAKLLRDPVWRRRGSRPVGHQPPVAHRGHGRQAPGHPGGAAVDGLTADDVLATPIACPHGVQPDTPFVRCARAGFSTDTSADKGAYCLVTFSVSAYGTERRTILEMSPLYLDACRYFVTPAARGGVSARDLVSLVPGLVVDEGPQLIQMLLDAGFVRPAMAIDAWGGPAGCGRGVYGGLRRQAKHYSSPPALNLPACWWGSCGPWLGRHDAVRDHREDVTGCEFCNYS